ncbi:Fibrinogen-like protein A [Mytilus coruscus]|uniref:Fibrinogen-like protein A n=1 Tax=Mytilus coruscus TaxID=42192 RepID=A0A6J8A5U8_MYTCO|nr:Fibrinogen-like protein A [Mytilus coruscus]
MVIVVASCLAWSCDIYVTASGSDIKDIRNEDPGPLSIPLINDKGAPLVSMLDTSTIYMKIKVYIRTLMKETIQNAVQEQIQNIFKTSLDENSTIDLIRNMTIQGINDILKEQGQVKLLDSIRHEEVSNARKLPDEDFRVDDIMYKLQGKCLPEDHDISGEDLKRDTQNILNSKNRLNLLRLAKIIWRGKAGFQTTDNIDTGRRKEIKKDYENGFGNVDGEYWLGNKHIYNLTSSSKYELRIELTDMSNTKKYAVYTTFVVGDAASKYKLTVGDYSGNAGDKMAYHNGMKFSTTDQDNDEHGSSCVSTYGPWWHKSCCYSGLNRKINKNLYWQSFSSYAAKTSVMMIRKLK